MGNFSYSKLSTFEDCGWRYKLQYVDGHFINTATIATDFGTLIHYVEELMGNALKDPSAVFLMDPSEYINTFINNNDDNALGAKALKVKYPKDFSTPDKSGMDYEEKSNHYLNNGIFFLKNFMLANPNLVILDTEKEFNLEYGEYNFHGFIDRVFQDKNTGDLVMEDIKTWPSIKNHDVVTPLQFVIYTLAAEKLYGVSREHISCFYYLPFAMERYPAGTKGFINRGIKKIDKLLQSISDEEFIPNPTPLCHWCVFSKTYPDQPDEAKNLCPYCSNWTRENRDFSTEFDWMGLEHHQEILESFIKNHSEKQKNSKSLKAAAISVLPEISISKIPLAAGNTLSSRFVLVRR